MISRFLPPGREQQDKPYQPRSARQACCYTSTMTEWTPDLSTGVSVLDEQHKAIFQWLAQLESASAEQRTLFGVYVLTRLKHHMREHFATEEAMMKAVGYPDLARHQAEHEVFRTRLEELQLKSIAQDISADTVHFLSHWLGNHIAESDLAYAPFLTQGNPPAK